MSVNATSIFSGFNSGSSLTSGTLVPTPNRRYMIGVSVYRGDSSNPNTPTISLWGLTWTLLETIAVDIDSSSRRYGYVFTAETGDEPSSGAMTITSTSAGEIAAVLDEISGAIVGTIVQTEAEPEPGNVLSFTVTLPSTVESTSAMWTYLLWVPEVYPNSTELCEITTAGFSVIGDVRATEIGASSGFCPTPSQNVTWNNVPNDTTPNYKGLALVEIDATSTVPPPVIYSVTPDTFGHGASVVIEWGPAEDEE